MSWEPDPGANAWVQMPSATQLANYVQEAVQWVQQNPTVAEANTVLIYAWNEHDEGGWLSPTLSKYGGTERIDAMHSLFGSSVWVRELSIPQKVPAESKSWILTSLNGKVVQQGFEKALQRSLLPSGIYWYQSGHFREKIIVP